ncbi:LysR family transcriptional regulator [Paraoerskovia marina]|uniref:LysR family transcriptional regulator n=1 Tax=Paraoerskovia marina TaxID=545619 RepID=UPI000492282A|nr:LysR family transcriptional regulator [Paraoerskovia marina]
MELQQLRYVVAVAELSSFTKAAARCFVVQSALSHQIKALEKELGVALFARTSRRVELTAAGRAFLPGARASLDAAERAGDEAAAAAGEVRGRLTVGMIPTVTAVSVPAVLKEFRDAHPHVRVALQVGGSDTIAAEIAAGETDVGLLGLPAGREPRGVDWREIGTDRLVAVLARQHRLADHESIGIDDLAQEAFADFPVGSPGRAQSDLAFSAAGISRDVPFEAMSTEILLDLARENLAVTLLPSRYVRAVDGLVAVPVVDGPSRVEYLAWSEFNLSPAARAFLRLL